jgi:hypothetical protein
VEEIETVRKSSAHNDDVGAVEVQKVDNSDAEEIGLLGNQAPCESVASRSSDEDR